MGDAEHARTEIPSGVLLNTEDVPLPSDPEHLITREERAGTCLYGAEGLATPGVDKVRLTPGKAVPGTRYRIVRWLGEGGMGVVYEAEHVDIERRVALKILRFDLSQQPHMVDVFKAEAKAAGRLGSKHVVEIYDFGELRDGRLFFAMELLEGANLCPSGDGPQIPPSELIGILRQVCKGLARAHEAGVVHRDVKPENIILARGSDGRRWVKLVDFGISSMLAAGQEWLSGRISGTPHYMAPEQIMLEAFDHRLDIYALGCTAYELLTGRPPFRAETVEAVLHQHLAEIAEAPSKVCPDAGIPAALDVLISRCLAKRAEDRYADASDLEAALCEVQIAAGFVTEWDDLPLPDIPDTERRERIRQAMPSGEPVAKRGWTWPLLAGASTLAAMGLGLFLAFGRGPSEEAQSLVDTLTIEARRAASTASWLAPAPGRPEGDSAYHKILAIEGIEGQAESFADARGQELRVDFSQTLARQGHQLWEHGARQLALVYFLNALVFDPMNDEATQRIDLPAPIIAGYIARAKDGELSGEERALNLFAAAEVESNAETRDTLASQAESVLQEMGGDGSERAILLTQALPVSARRARDERAIQSHRRARADAEPEVIPPPPDLAAVAPDLPPPPPQRDSLLDAGDNKKPRQGVAKATLGADARDPEHAQALANEGSTALLAGRRREAASLFHQAIASDRRNTTALMGLADVYFDTGETQKAVDYAEKAVEAAPGNSGFRLKLGDAYFKALRYNDALRQYEEAKVKGSTRAAGRIDKVRDKIGS